MSERTERAGSSRDTRSEQDERAEREAAAAARQRARERAADEALPRKSGPSKRSE